MNQKICFYKNICKFDSKNIAISRKRIQRVGTQNPHIMEYKVRPFNAKVSGSGTSGDVANQVQNYIASESNDGWEFVSCGNIDTTIKGSNGCFGIGASPTITTSVLVLVFKK